MEEKNISYKKAFLLQRLQTLKMELQAIQWQVPQMLREEKELIEVLRELEDKEEKEECLISKV